MVLAAAEAISWLDILDPAVEALEHAVGVRPHRRGQAVLDVEFGMETVVVAGRGVAAQAEEPVGENPSRLSVSTSSVRHGKIA